MSRYARATDMDSWLQDERVAERGFSHRWQSRVGDGNGEDAFLDLVGEHVGADVDVLDIGCGHGELTLSLAPSCRSAIGIDRDEGFLKLAIELATERSIANVKFLQVEIEDSESRGQVHNPIPLDSNSIDLIINRRGPVLKRYLNEAKRIGRPNATMIGLHPTGNTPAPIWASMLPPEYESVFMALPFEEVAGWVVPDLLRADIHDYSLWWIDVPEYLRDGRELCDRLTSGRKEPLPTYEDVKASFEAVVKQYGGDLGVVVRHQRLLWRARLTT